VCAGAPLRTCTVAGGYSIEGKILPATEKDERLVKVTHDGETVEALWNPGFIIKSGDKYYLTLAVWEYENVPHETERQLEGVAEIIHLFNEGIEDGKLVKAVSIPNIHHNFHNAQIVPNPNKP
jgi:hypothetical protein